MPPKKGQRNSNMARLGRKNPKWKDGRSSDYRRRITKAKKNELVHHRNKDKKDNRRSNFEVLKPRKSVTARGVHNKRHPERNRK